MLPVSGAQRPTADYEFALYDRGKEEEIFTDGGTQMTCDGESARRSRERPFLEDSEAGEVSAERVRRCLS